MNIYENSEAIGLKSVHYIMFSEQNGKVGLCKNLY